MAIDNSYIEALRSRLSIADIIGRRVTWDKRKSQPSRGDYWACCPFHGEKSPSFHVEERKGFYYCFGCQAKGDAIKFTMEIDNLSFREAVEMLATEAGLPPPVSDPRAREREEKRVGLIDVTEAAQRFFRGQFQSGAAREARDYIRRRGLSEEIVERFGIGFAPRGGLIETLRDAGIEAPLMLEAGLTAPRDDGSMYERFRDRITFPIRDPRGRVIAFGGRAMSADAQAKYLNSPETPLFSKGRVLFNYGSARAATGKGAPLIVAEGYMDVIALAQAGFEGAVAPLGTALTEDQLDLLWRAGDEPLLALDGDSAGMRAALRAVGLALPKLAPGKSLRFALMPGGQDPDDLIRAGGAQAMQGVLDASIGLAEMLWRRETEGRSFDSPERRAALDAALKQALSEIGDGAVAAHYREDFRERRRALFAPKRQPFRKNEGFRRSGRFYTPPVVATVEVKRSMLAAAAPDRREQLERSAVVLSLAPDGLTSETAEALAELTFANRTLDLIRGALISRYFEQSSSGDPMPPEALAHAARRSVPRDAASILDSLLESCPKAAPAGALAAAIGRLQAETSHAETWGEEEDAERAYRARLAAEAERERLRATGFREEQVDETPTVQHFVEQRIWIKKPKPFRGG